MNKEGDVTSDIIYIYTLRISIEGQPAKKHPSSPNLGLKEAHFGARYSAVNVPIETMVGNAYPNTIVFRYLFWFSGYPL